MANENISFYRRLTPLIFSQFLGVFNDNAFKMLIILCVFKGHADFFKDSVFLFKLSLAYILPFILLCAPAGGIADRLHKRSTMVLSKVLEFGILIFGTVRFLRKIGNILGKTRHFLIRQILLQTIIRTVLPFLDDGTKLCLLIAVHGT